MVFTCFLGRVCFNIARSVWFSCVSWVDYVLISPGACGFTCFLGRVCFNIARSVWFSRVSWIEYVSILPGACCVHVFPG